jgi:FtsP/CotA-like multicopper oxidase with cupredoxin domain
MKKIRVLLFVVSLCAASGQALAFDVKVVQGDRSCPTGRTLLDLAQATANQQEVCKALGEWYIARLAGGGSMDGPGYGCKIRPADERSLGHSLCAVGAQAQPDCSPGRELITIPEIKHENGKLRAVLMLTDQSRGMWDYRGDRCMWQHLRYFKGWNVKDWNAADPPPSWPSYGEPIPGPTLRARIGDQIQISFLNQINTKNFPTSLDVGEKGQTSGCDEAFGTAQVPVDPEKPDGPKKTIKVNIYPRNDTMPNCLHGSSTSNLHFHGTHTTPGTTGDNVLLYIRPVSRDKKGKIEPTDEFVKSAFGEFFKWCETNGPPTRWDELPLAWREKQQALLEEYDRTAPYQGKPGNLPEANKLWPQNYHDIKKGQWPQISIGAFPYCFRVPDYEDYKEGKVKMAQAPGTHWYHAHKHGSTALNVGNGMTGALIIEGPYDDTLRDFYTKTNPDPGLEEKVLVIQQLETSLKMLSAKVKFAPAPLSVNGRRQPVIKMRPGQVQMWRIVNGAPRTFVQFRNFAPPQGTRETVDWRQTAQDGVQFHPDNYEKIGKLNGQFNMAGANRVDLLVRAPKTTGSYELKVRESVLADPTAENADRDNSTLLTVKVEGEAVTPPMEFIDKGSFPKLPDFLEDIPEKVLPERDIPPPPRNRQLVFDTKPGSTRGGGDPPGDLPLHTIDDKLLTKDISQSMVLNTAEEWTVVNKAVGIAHPFHIHINPFQLVAVFDPNSAEASDKKNACYADPKDPKTWDPKTRNPSCTALQAPFVWWDALAIPSAREDPLDCAQDEGKYVCPSPKGGACSLAGDPPNQKQQCTVKIPGYFKMRSRFVDFPGYFVQHCHILAHEDRGMMQFVEICPKGGPCPTKTQAEAFPFTHH